MNSYCITFNINYHRAIKKLKVDYGLVSCEFKDGVWKSSVSNETFTNLKKTKLGYLRFFKKKDQVFYQLIVENQDSDFEKVESKILNLARKDLKWKIPFRFNYKKKLDERVLRIINPSNGK